jgi:hypothetical protein
MTHHTPDFSRLLRACIGVVALLLFAFEAQAQVPERMHYQGFITTTSGFPVDCLNPATCDVPMDMTFRIYADPFADALLWEEDHLDVSVVGGVFNITLGEIEPLTPQVFSGPSFLGIEINGNEELEPRQEIVSAAYALRSNDAVNAQNLGGIAAEDFVQIADIGQLQGPDGPPGTEGTNGLNALAVTTTEHPGSVCALGGVRINSGLDTNGNQVLDVEEVTNTLPVCNGEKGPAGAKGDTGAGGPAGPPGAKGDKGDKGSQGSQGPAGSQGPQGAAGSSGFASFVGTCSTNQWGSGQCVCGGGTKYMFPISTKNFCSISGFGGTNVKGQGDACSFACFK